MTHHNGCYLMDFGGYKSEVILKQKYRSFNPQKYVLGGNYLMNHFNLKLSDFDLNKYIF